MAPPVKLDKIGIEVSQNTMSNNFVRVKERVKGIVEILELWPVLEPDQDEALQLADAIRVTLEQMQALTDRIWATNLEVHKQIQELVSGSPIRKRQEPSPTAPFSSVDTNVPTYVPPPKTDITQELINQSLTVQPQDTATVSSVIPQLKDGVITFLIQLNGIVASTLAMNASTSFPCDTVGSGIDPNIVLVPKYVQEGTQQTTIADCMCIAANMYDRNVITYWIQNCDGEIFSLVGSNKVHDIDRINTSAPIALSLRPSVGSAKRNVFLPTNFVVPKRRQIFNVDCNNVCPFEGMKFFEGRNDHCGCMFKKSLEASDLWARGIAEPDASEATMTAEACAAMTCINNGGRPAMFNPFSLTCWCADPAYVENNPSGWSRQFRSLFARAFN